MAITLETPEPKHRNVFLDAVQRSGELHHPWVSPPQTPQAFDAYLLKCGRETNRGFFAFSGDGGLVGCININEIVRGAFQSAYLGFYAFVPFAGKGMMKRALTLTIDQAFSSLGLHRLEANVQPGNAASLGLVRSLGFRHEGHSPRYLYINNQWRDHERYAITVEDWQHETD